MEGQVYPVLGVCVKNKSHRVVNYTDGVEILSSYCLDCNTLTVDNESVIMPDDFIEEIQNTYEVLTI